MALPAAVYEIRTSATASNVNGGGFNSARGGTDYSQQDAAQLTGTDLTCTAASTTITSATGGFTSIMVGNFIHLTALTGTGAIVGWYEIVTFTDTNNVIVDRTPTNGVNNITAGTFYVGGALSLATAGAAGDDDVFELAAAGGGNTFHIKSGTYTLGEAVSIAISGSGANPNKAIGYQTTRGDNPTGANRPTFICGANNFISAVGWYWNNLIFTGTGTSVLNLGSGEILAINIKSTNTSTTASRNAFSGPGGDSMAFNCEAISYRGNGFSTSGRYSIVGCYIHDCDTGIQDTGTAIATIIGNIIESCSTAAIVFSGVKANLAMVKNNTLYGSENTTGIGINITGANAVNFRVFNNIIYGFVTGVSHGTANTEGFDDYNDYFNNDNDVNAAANWQKGSNDAAINPAFTSVTQLTGITATTSGSVLTQSGGDFSSVVDGRDFLYLVSGTGITAGIYGITAHTSDTITLDIAPGTNATADKVWQITVGRNFAITGAI